MSTMTLEELRDQCIELIGRVAVDGSCSSVAVAAVSAMFAQLLRERESAKAAKAAITDEIVHAALTEYYGGEPHPNCTPSMRAALEAVAPMLASAPSEAVAVVGDVYTLHWIGSGPILPLIEKYGIKVGDKLYTAPIATKANTQVSVEMPAEFGEWFGKNYPGPDTIIGNPHWHAPRIWRAARRAALAAAPKPETEE